MPRQAGPTPIRCARCADPLGDRTVRLWLPKHVITPGYRWGGYQSANLCDGCYAAIADEESQRRRQRAQVGLHERHDRWPPLLDERARLCGRVLLMDDRAGPIGPRCSTRCSARVRDAKHNAARSADRAARRAGKRCPSCGETFRRDGATPGTARPAVAFALTVRSRRRANHLPRGDR